MIFSGLTTLQIAFLIVAPLSVILLLVFFVVIPVNKKREKEN
jgi:predicted MFS family arabinose efflux permease